MKKVPFSLVVENKIAELNSAMTSIASFLGSWLAFLPEAAMAALAFKSILGWGNFLSWLVALSLEFVGHELNGYYQSALEFNAAEELWMKKHGAKNLRYPKENTKLALKLLVIFYIVTGIFVIGTSIFIAVRDADWIKLLVVPLPFATGIGNVITNRAAALHRKKVQIERDKNAKNESATKIMPVAPKPDETETQAVELNERQIAIVEKLRESPRINYTQLGEEFGVSRTTATSDVKVLVEAGIVKKNGSGWRVENDQ